MLSFIINHDKITGIRIFKLIFHAKPLSATPTASPLNSHGQPATWYPAPRARKPHPARPGARNLAGKANMPDYRQVKFRLFTNHRQLTGLRALVPAPTRRAHDR